MEKSYQTLGLCWENFQMIRGETEFFVRRNIPGSLYDTRRSSQAGDACVQRSRKYVEQACVQLSTYTVRW